MVEQDTHADASPRPEPPRSSRRCQAFTSDPIFSLMTMCVIGARGIGFATADEAHVDGSTENEE